MDNYSLILNNMSMLVKNHKILIPRKQIYFFRGSSQLGQKFWHNEKRYNVIPNKLCNLFSRNVLQKNEISKEMLDKKLVKQFV